MIPKPKRAGRFVPITLKTVSLTILALGIATVGVGAAVLLYLAKDLPTVEQIAQRQVSQSTKIYDRTGQVLLYEISGGEKRTVVPIEEIPMTLREATIAIEDERFYDEPAFDWRGYVRALIVNLQHGEIRQGGSTITVQLARNAFLTPEQTIARKIRELLLAIRLGQQYTKDEILGLYLNEIPYGATVYGVEAASSAYFGKSVSELSLAESAVLASIPRAPSYYSPWGNHVNELIDRQHLVLDKMFQLGMISQEERDAAKNEKVVFQPQGIGIKAPHFVLTVQDYLLSKYGEDAVRQGGLTVVTTLDWNLQQLAEKVVADGAARNEKLYDGTNAALVAEDTNTGQVLALVGSRDYFDAEHDGNFNVATQGLRQPGSALKPFVYLEDFRKGLLPDTMFFDVPTEFVPNNPTCPAIPDYDTENKKCFHPQDFEPDFKGPVSVRTALAQSINIPAVKALYVAGLPDTLSLLRDVGLKTLVDPSRYGLSLVLGGGEVHLVDLVEAYATLAEEGTRHEQSYVLEVKDSSGRTLETYEDKKASVVEPQYTRMVTDILSDADARSGLFQSSLDLTVFDGYAVALKTGTSNDYRDAWTVGYTPSLAVGVWAGNNDNTPMHRQGSSLLAAVPMWSAFMTEALKSYEPEAFTRPDPVTPSRPVFGGEYLVNGQPHSILYFINREDPAGPPPLDPTQDPQFNNWEAGVTAWSFQNGGLLTGSTTPLFDFSSPQPKISLHNPSPGSRVPESRVIPVWATITSPTPLTRVAVYFNGGLVQEITSGLGSGYSLITQIQAPFTALQNSVEVDATNAGGFTSKTSAVLFQ